MGTCCTACNEEASVRNKPLTVKKVTSVKKKPVVQAKVAKVMDEYASGDLKSSSGKPVEKKSQAVAVALSEGRRAAKKKS